MKEPMYIRKAETESIMGDNIILYYFTYETEHMGEAGCYYKYGIGIDMYTQYPNERTVRERRIVENLFVTKREAEALVDKLWRGMVTPATLEDIVDDSITA